MQNKRKGNQLMKGIFDLTLSFQMEFPVIYDNLSETPLFLDYENKGMSKIEFEEYYKFLKVQLRVFEKQRLPGRNIIR
ncbi:hypothetical protein F8C76_08265 [Flagellimonas olearia]|uniref:Uncharacterized protein n=1 Tax=Flagellimonas olearia TaxID=552546 RepID=A0A6I1E120_9FLAO|nr:hypothetical protein [Allomuricauda olearia]KAB7531473.1 hypothetical protein F8C76_08265 [Allomuricauda olearia]